MGGCYGDRSPLEHHAWDPRPCLGPPALQRADGPPLQGGKGRRQGSEGNSQAGQRSFGNECHLPGVRLRSPSSSGGISSSRFMEGFFPRAHFIAQLGAGVTPGDRRRGTRVSLGEDSSGGGSFLHSHTARASAACCPFCLSATPGAPAPAPVGWGGLRTPGRSACVGWRVAQPRRLPPPASPRPSFPPAQLRLPPLPRPGVPPLLSLLSPGTSSPPALPAPRASSQQPAAAAESQKQRRTTPAVAAASVNPSPWLTGLLWETRPMGSGAGRPESKAASTA